MPPATIALRDWGLLLFLSVLWGGSFLFVGIAVKDLPPLVIVMVRVAIAAAALLPFDLVMIGDPDGLCRAARDIAAARDRRRAGHHRWPRVQ